MTVSRFFSRRSSFNNRGFTLLELIVALGLFAGAVVILLAAQTAAGRNMAQARHEHVAAGLLREAFTNLELDGLPSSGEEEGDFGDDFPDYKWKVKTESAQIPADILAAAQGMSLGPNAAALAGMIPEMLKKVTLTVMWTEQSATKQVSMVYYEVAQ